MLAHPSSSGCRKDSLWERHAEELVVSKELVHPSLEAEVLRRLPLASR